MTAREFLNEIIKNLPSRGLDQVSIHITLEDEYGEREAYPIINITNHGCNDLLEIELVKGSD